MNGLTIKRGLACGLLAVLCAWCVLCGLPAREASADTHVYPDKIAAKAVGATGGFYGVGYRQDGRVATLYSCMEDAGTDRSLIHSVATTPRQVAAINEFLAQRRRRRRIISRHSISAI